jgi:hypothetical protein
MAEANHIHTILVRVRIACLTTKDTEERHALGSEFPIKVRAAHSVLRLVKPAI